MFNIFLTLTKQRSQSGDNVVKVNAWYKIRFSGLLMRKLELLKMELDTLTSPNNARLKTCV